MVIFYESGKLKGKKQAIGIGRVTFSEVMKANKVGHRFARQGVVEIPDIKNLADKNEQVHVFTFDNFTEFPEPLSFKNLQNNGCISRANLVTVERLDSLGIKYICSHGFSSKQDNK